MRTKRSALTGACLVFAWTGMLAAPVHAAEDAAAGEEAIEEVVVTGSYLKRTAQDSPSPLSVVTSADIEDIGAADVAEIIATLPWQSGSQTRAATFQGEGADGRATVNLRNLGQGATLPLVNGKRQVPSFYGGGGDASVNVNGLIPNIAIDRIEIVKDGSSALYGSDAIAGVVNFLTKKDFEGMDMSYNYTVDEETGEGRVHEIEAIWGIQGDRGGIVASASFMDRGEINIDDRYDRFGGSSASSTGQPGRLVPRPGQTIRWAAHGLNPGQPVTGNRYPRNAQGTSFGQADVDCENSARLERGGPIGPVLGNNICAYDFGSFFALQASEQLTKFHVTGNYDFTDTFEAYFEFAANDSEFDRLNSLNPNAPSLPIAATHPGAIEDAFRRGIEPIAVSNLTRLLGGTRNTPKSLRPLDTFTQSNYSDQRLVIGGLLDLDFGGRDWTLDASITKSEHDAAITQVQDTQSAQMLLAINGRGGPNCNPITGTPGEGNLAYAASGGNFGAGRCYFFNPFGNSAFNRTGGTQTNLALVNPPELYNWLAGRASSDSVYSETVLDVVLSGELFQLNDLPVGLAVGFQRRADKGKLVVDSALKSNNLDFAFGADDWRGKLTTTAIFAEIGVPLHETLDVNLALRYEDFDEIGADTTDPKVTVLWRPLDSLSVRASAGTSFRVGSMQQLFGSLTTVANQTDVLGDSAFRPSITVGNESLKPESVDTYNIGLSWAPTEGFLEGFQFDIDYYRYKYKDIIGRQASAAILLADNQALQAAIAGGQTLVGAINAGVGNRRQVIRNGDGFLLRILPDFENSDEAEIDGIDISTSYRFDTDFGMFRVGVQAAWAKTYDVTSSTGQKFDAIGEYNEFTPVARPLPEWKVNGNLSWSMDNHRAFMLIQYVDSLDYGVDLATDPRAGAARFWRETVNLVHGPDTAADFFTRDIKSMTTVDLHYTYTFNEVSFLNSTEVTLGVKNVFDEEPPWIPVNTAYDGTLHDMRGRVWFLGVNMSM